MIKQDYKLCTHRYGYFTSTPLNLGMWGSSCSPGRALKHFKHLTDRVDGFLDLMADLGTNFKVKLRDYVKVRDDVFEFCQFYAKWLDNPLMKRLKADMYEVLEQAVSRWGDKRSMTKWRGGDINNERSELLQRSVV